MSANSEAHSRVHEVSAALEPTDSYGYEADVDRSWIGDPAVRQVVAEAAAAAIGTPVELVHAEYQPMNMLWEGRFMTGLVDWAFAGSGTRELDVGQRRLALTTLYSVNVAEEFRRCYEHEADLRLDGRADIRALLAYGPGWRDFLRRVVGRRRPVDMRGMNDRVATLIRKAVGQLE